MLSITPLDGSTLMAPQTVLAIPPGESFLQIHISTKVSESDPNLAWVAATLDWNGCRASGARSSDKESAPVSLVWLRLLALSFERFRRTSHSASDCFN